MRRKDIRLPGLAFLILLAVQAGESSSEAVDAGSLNQQGTALFRTGHFEEAADKFEEALEEDPSSEIIQRNLGHALASLGQKKFVAGDLDAARDLLVKAIDQWPQEASFHILQGTISLLRGELYDARRAVDNALDLDEDDPRARELLGDIYYREGLLTRALPEWEAALETAGPHTHRLEAKVSRARKEDRAESGFGRDVSIHFTLQYDEPVSAELGQAVLQILEEAYDSIGDELGTYPTGDIPVILYSKILFTEITQSPLWVAGTFDGKIRVPVGGISSPHDVARLRSILVHELAHAFIRSAAPKGLPLWFEEGLAKHFEDLPTDLIEDQLRRLRDATPKTFQGLIGGLRGRGGSVEASYLGALFAVRLLIEGEGFWTVRRIVEAVGRGQSFGKAFRGETSMEVDEFQEKWIYALP